MDALGEVYVIRLTHESIEGILNAMGHDGGPERLAIVGSGTVACGLAACAANSGVAVTLWARSDRSLEAARASIERDREDTGEVALTRDLDSLSEATLLVEAVIEDEYVKHEVLRTLTQRGDAAALLASTTSSLSIGSLAGSSGAPERFFGLHVFNPVTKMKLVELCFPTEATTTVRRRATAFCETLGKTVVEVPDEPGFVVNRLLFPYLFDAVRLLERTGLEPAEVDACMKLGASHPMGPLELLDFVGIDVADAIGEALYADTGDAAHRPPGRIKKLVGERRLGRKSGAGFYEY
jgi:3-hydroxybutyryl-CoA dehydrogenase